MTSSPAEQLLPSGAMATSILPVADVFAHLPIALLINSDHTPRANVQMQMPEDASNGT